MRPVATANGAVRATPGDLSREGRLALATAEEPRVSVDLPIFTAGEDYSVADLDAMQANAGPQGAIAQAGLTLEPTLIIGHGPEELQDDTKPAWGLGQQVWRVGKTLWQHFREVPQSMAAAIQAGRWPKWSVEIYRDFRAVVNGVTRSFGPAVRRVALLGAEIPERKDLGAPVWRYGEHEPAFARVMCVRVGGEVVRFAEPPPAAPAAPAKAAPPAAPGQKPGGSRDAAMRAMETAMLAWKNGTGSEDEVNAALAALVAAIEGDTGGEQPPEGPPMSQHAEPVKPAPKPEAKTPEPTPDGQVITFAEHKVTLATLASERTAREATEARVKALENDKRGMQVDAFCEELRRDGLAVGAINDAVRTYFRKHSGVDTFAEKDERDPVVSAMTLLRTVLAPHKLDTSGRHVAAAAQPATDKFSEIDATLAKWKTDPNGKASGLELVFYARGTGIPTDTFAEWATARQIDAKTGVKVATAGK